MLPLNECTYLAIWYEKIPEVLTPNLKLETGPRHPNAPQAADKRNLTGR